KAGTEYIKSDEDLEDIFKKSSSTCFKNTYFLFSSSSSEASIAKSEYSLFTKSFADAIVANTGQVVRYRDLMAYISDDTTVTSRQTPLFIQQANNTEVFCEVTEDLIKAICKGTCEEGEEDKPVTDDSSEIKPSPEDKLIETIETRALEFCTEEEAQQSLLSLVQSVLNYKFKGVLEKLYEINVEQKNSYNGITGMKNIGKWLSKENEPYFIKIEYDMEEYEAKERVEYERSAFAIAGAFGAPKRIEYETVTKYRNVIDGFQLTATTPCNAIEISLVPKEQILPWYKVFIVFVFSKSKLAIFYKYEKEKEISWNHRQTLNHQKWKTMICTLKDKDSIQKSTRTFMTNIKDSLTSELSSIFLES
ncbi:hypothetical protein KA005_72210, partial [bacterium]|nr:hypothetical protein [bacterium]